MTPQDRGCTDIEDLERMGAMEETRSSTRLLKPAIVAVLICEGAGLIGSIFTRAGLNGWFQTLNKPSFNPPGWVFGPVWTVLYALMGIAAAMIWQHRDTDPEARPALRMFGVHLALNVLWSAAFFGARSPLAALINIVALWVALVATIQRFARISGRAAGLMLPYLAWTTFATVLNAAIWRLNR